jgi:dTDP-glucose pyrophosphorylase/CBS domain-containing protein
VRAIERKQGASSSRRSTKCQKEFKQLASVELDLSLSSIAFNQHLTQATTRLVTMKHWESILVQRDASMREAIEKIDAAATQMALVVDEKGCLLGTLTDGDVRRGLLAGLQLTDTVDRCMCIVPTTARMNESREDILEKMRGRRLHQIPVLDDRGRIIDLKTIDDYLVTPPRENWVVIMAGGLGSRLKELTQETPKPMLAVGNRPLLETIVVRFVEQGFKNIWLSVNYHADKIERHFGDGKKFGAKLKYLHEDKRLGTAGALSLLPEIPVLPVLVTNADLLVSIDYSKMLEAHHSMQSSATMAVREYEYQIPYGVVRTVDDKIEALDEKPIHRALVNAGIYVLSPDALTCVPGDTFFDMPELFAALIKEKRQVRHYEISGYWLDVGRHEDLQKANADFANVFV